MTITRYSDVEALAKQLRRPIKTLIVLDQVHDARSRAKAEL